MPCILRQKWVIFQKSIYRLETSFHIPLIIWIVADDFCLSKKHWCVRTKTRIEFLTEYHTNWTILLSEKGIRKYIHEYKSKMILPHNVNRIYLSLLTQTTGSQGSEICLHLTPIEYTSCHEIERPDADLSSDIPWEGAVSGEPVLLLHAPPLFWLGVLDKLIFSFLLVFLPFCFPFLLDSLQSDWRERQIFETFWAISIAANPAIRCC